MYKFLIIIGSCYAFINAWIIWWFWRSLNGAGTLRLCVCAFILLLASSFPVLYKNSGGSAVEIFFLRSGAFWIGIFVYLFFLVLLMDIYGIAARISIGARVTPPGYVVSLFVFGIPLLLGCAGWLIAANPVIKTYDIFIQIKGNIPPGYEEKPVVIAAMSDMHLGRTITPARLAKAMNLLTPHQPDMVLFLGDMIDDHILQDTEAMRAALSVITPRMGFLGILGNHEYIAGDIETSLSLLRQGGISMLRDEWRIFEDAFLLVGRDDLSKQRFLGEKRCSLNSIMKDIPEQYRHLPVIVMDHQPAHLEEAEHAGVALQLSGHTHNGQIWPFDLVARKVYENALGHSTRGGTQYIVTAGIGTWGPPARNNARPEVLLVRIHFVTSGG